MAVLKSDLLNKRSLWGLMLFGYYHETYNFFMKGKFMFYMI